MATHLTLEMSISRPDFLRRLPAAVGQEAVQEENGGFSGQEGSRRWTIRLVPLPDRQLAQVVLPCHRVEIGLEGYDAPEADGFMARFHRSFQRGGG
jgi:hypothetical protein